MLLKLYAKDNNPRDMRRVVDILNDGGIVIYPTDTMYAIGCHALKERAVERICKLKKLDPAKSHLSIICYDLSSISEYARISTPVFKLMKRNLPGPFTFILPGLSRLPKVFRSRQGQEVGIRMPDHPLLREIARQLDAPIMTTTLPVTDDMEPEYSTDPELIDEAFGDMVDLVMASKAQVFLGNKRIRKLEVSAREVEAIWASCHPRPRNLVEDFAYPAGVVSGLAVSMGEGFMVPVEARNSRQGDLKELRLTGLYDRSMGESAEVAYELVDSWAMEHLGHGLGVVAVNYSYAVEKRGDSASLATALAIISDLLGHPVPKTTAVTGAISLKGNVLPVGSVVAKVLGAASQGADTVITPCCDSDGLSGIPEGYLPRIRIIRVRCFSEAVEAAFGPVLVQDGPKVRTAS